MLSQIVTLKGAIGVGLLYMTVLDLAKKRRKIYPVMGNDGVKCALSQGNFPLPCDFWLFFQNCQVE